MLEPLIPRLKREIEARLAELRPLVAEAERLQAVRAALLADASAGTRASRRHADAVLRELDFGALRNGMIAVAKRESKPAAEENGAEDRQRAPRGANQEAILAVVEERPGVSVAEIAAVTKIPKPTVATTVSRLKREGVLAPEAGGVKLASRQPLTLAQIAANGQGDGGVGDA